MIALLKEHKGFWKPERKRSLYLGLLLVLLSVIIQITFGHYSYSRAITAGPASDIFLDNLPVINLGFILVGGAIALWLAAIALFVIHPRYLIFSVKAVALYIISRAFFFSLTHIGPYPTNVSPGPDNIGYGFYHLITFQGNFFYSGHTGFPFLLALIFWDNNFLRRLFIFLTVFFGASVLLAHVHYSIDVFAAPFIVYGMFIMTTKIFPRDYAIISSERP
jgi:hypothetical protein